MSKEENNVKFTHIEHCLDTLRAGPHVQSRRHSHAIYRAG